MALSRKFLSAMDIEPEKIDEIISAHADTVDALKEERDAMKRDAETYKADAGKLAEVQKELDELKGSQGKNVFEDRFNEMKEKHDALKAEFDKYKSDVEAGETKRAKESAYRNLLHEKGISDKRIDKIIKVTDIDSVELDKEGGLKDKDKISKSIDEEWEDFIPKKGQEGAGVANPPGSNTQVPKGESRAAKIAAQYHANLYGQAKEGN